MLRTTALLALIVSAAMAGPLQAQQAAPPQRAPRAEPPLPAPASAEEVVAAARTLLKARYVIPETATRLDAALVAATKAGEFGGLMGDALADRMNAVMRRVTSDGHLLVSYDPRQAAEVQALPPLDRTGAPPPEMIAEIAARVANENAGIAKLERLPGNVRYIDYRGFAWGAEDSAPPAIEHAMRFLKEGDAIIIDLRQNNGGSADAVARLASYFLPAGTALIRFEERGKPPLESKTVATPFSLAGKPAYFLIGRGSASAAEEFAQHVAAFKLGKIVGETTAGAAFNNEFKVLPGGYLLSVSFARPVHARTGGDWEGKGVAPDMAVQVARALAAAQVDALTSMLPTLGPRERFEVERIIPYYRAEATPVAPALDLAAYQGVYGPRTIRLVDGELTTNRTDRPPSQLRAISRDTFSPANTPFQRFRFIVEGGKVVALEVDGGNGAERSERKPLP